MTENKEFERIFKPYLIHIEFEILNIMTQLQINKQLRKYLSDKGYYTHSFESITGIFLSKIKQLIAIMNH